MTTAMAPATASADVPAAAAVDAPRTPLVSTQKTPDQAAALIQARVRGQQTRQRQERAIRGITRLQARQRGRFTRREYQQLLTFYNEQESFYQETKRRQLRIWRHEQELYFLQHTTADELERLRAFQYRRSARRIQREWRRGHPRLVSLAPGEEQLRFDPFGLTNQSESMCREPHQLDDRPHELFGSIPASGDGCWTNREAVEEGTHARRRLELQEQLRRRRKDLDKNREVYERERRLGAKEPTRRELYEQLLTLRSATAQRLQSIKSSASSARYEETARVVASCKNRLGFLLDESRVATLLSMNGRHASGERIEQERQRFEETTRSWPEERKRVAWENHHRILESVLGKEKWFETYIAGECRDIRRVYAKSPWEHERKVWQWRPSQVGSGNRTDTSKASEQQQPPSPTAIDRFVFCLSNADNEQDGNASDNQCDNDQVPVPRPLEDRLASVWWRAHATQAHFGYKYFQDRQKRAGPHHVVGNNENQDAHITPEMLVNPDVYKLYQKATATSREKELDGAVKSRIGLLEKRIQEKVLEVETQVEVNTRLIIDEKHRVQREKDRLSQEEKAAIQIQRYARGAIGRTRVQEHRAQYFVMVRGRAIRKGKCEECGDQQAVLECKECEESLHFCPVCWVQVHSTRRRKPHVPIPMAAQAPQSTVDTTPTSSRRNLELHCDTNNVQKMPRTKHYQKNAQHTSSNPPTTNSEEVATAGTNVVQAEESLSHHQANLSDTNMNKYAPSSVVVAIAAASVPPPSQDNQLALNATPTTHEPATKTPSRQSKRAGQSKSPAAQSKLSRRSSLRERIASNAITTEGMDNSKDVTDEIPVAAQVDDAQQQDIVSGNTQSSSLLDCTSQEEANTTAELATEKDRTDHLVENPRPAMLMTENAVTRSATDDPEISARKIQAFRRRYVRKRTGTS